MNGDKGDQAFNVKSLKGRDIEMTYGGALSFLRRKYTRDPDDIASADIIVSGIPFDNAVTNRPGCRFGPRAIRQSSTQLGELKAFPFGFDPFDHLAVIDWGDAFLDPHHPLDIPQTIFDHTKALIQSAKDGAKLLTLGGDHFVTYPLLKAHAEKYGPLSFLQFDAHSDTWPDETGRIDHGTMFGRAVKEGIIAADHALQIGIRTHVDDTFGMNVITAPEFHKIGIDETLKRIHQICADKPLYISFDIDCLDPAFAPGTGTPVPGGLASWQALELIRGLKSLNMIGFDLVEVSPAYDHAEITSLAAAHIAHDWICMQV